MTATGHAIIGTIIAVKFQNPQIALPLAFLSHIAADIIPHWDTATNDCKKGRVTTFIEAFFDVITGFALSFLIINFLYPNVNFGYVVLIIFASQFLDWATAPYYFLNLNFPPFNWVYKFQKLFDNKMDKPMGIIYQGIALILVFAIGFLF